MGGADMGEGTTVGLDVHARSVAAFVIDEASGEVAARRAPHCIRELVEWIAGLPVPVRATYEAGPTGFGRRAPCVGRGSRVWWRRRAGSPGRREAG